MLTKKQKEKLGIPTDIVFSRIVSGGRDVVREMVRARDKYTCQECGLKWKEGERRFDVHHIDPKEEGKSKHKGCVQRDYKQKDKMITLCHSCHLGLHTVIDKMIKGKQKQRVLNEEEKQDIINSYLKGERQIDIAKRLKITPQNVYRYIVKRLRNKDKSELSTV